MISLDAFFGLVAGQCPRVMDATMRDAVRDACIQFCKRTKIFSNTETVTTEIGQPSYYLFAEDGVAYEVESVQRDLAHLDKLSQHDFTALNFHAISGTPSAFYVNFRTELVLGPIPDSQETLTAQLYARPSDTATSVDDLLWSDWRQAIASGARAYIRRNHQPWEDREKEAKDLLFFEDAIAEANIARARGKTSRRLTTRAYYF